MLSRHQKLVGLIMHTTYNSKNNYDVDNDDNNDNEKYESKTTTLQSNFLYKR